MGVGYISFCKEYLVVPLVIPALRVRHTQYYPRSYLLSFGAFFLEYIQ